VGFIHGNRAVALRGKGAVYVRHQGLKQASNIIKTKNVNRSHGSNRRIFVFQDAVDAPRIIFSAGVLVVLEGVRPAVQQRFLIVDGFYSELALRTMSKDKVYPRHQLPKEEPMTS